VLREQKLIVGARQEKTFSLRAGAEGAKIDCRGTAGENLLVKGRR